jgi:HK97 family phage major capsid protein
MNLKELLKQKQTQLVELKSAIEAGDAEAIEKADAITTECADIEARIAKAAKASEMLAKLGNSEPKSAKAETGAVKSIGEFAAKHLDIASIKGRMGASVSTPAFKAPLEGFTNYSLQEVTYDRNIRVPLVETPLRDAFGSAAIPGNAYSWVLMADGEYVGGVTDEGEKKTPMGTIYGRVTAPLEKVTAFFKDTDELLEDNGYLANAIEQKGVTRLRRAGEDFIAGTLLRSISNPRGIQSDDGKYFGFAPFAEIPDGTTMTAPVLADFIYTAIANVKAASGVNPDAVVIGTESAKLLRTGRDGAGQYYGGGYFYGPYGNGGGFEMMPNLWGLKVIVSDALVGDVPFAAIVGNFKLGGTVVTKQNGGLRVEATNSNEDDFMYDIVTVRMEERLLLAINEPTMFSAVVLGD